MAECFGYRQKNGIDIICSIYPLYLLEASVNQVSTSVVRVQLNEELGVLFSHLIFS